jgi:hypothetical protein
MVCHYLRKNKIKEKTMSKKSLVVLVALMAITVALVALSSSIYATNGGCTVNGVPVPGDPYLIEGTKKADVIDCRTSPTGHHIEANDGDDLVYGSEYDDYIEGHGGNDTEYGMGGNDSIDGGAKNDTIYGGAGDDILFGGVGSSPASGVGCELQTAASGSSFFAKLFAKPFAKPMRKGGSGDDTIYGGDGNDCINAGSGEDLVYGDAGNDTLLGGNHIDYLDGGADYDYADGGWHDDSCIAEITVDCEYYP